MKNNYEQITEPYITADYYTNIFKPNKNAMIIGTFNNVEVHIADFDAFRQRASELVDRLVNNKISECGGISFVSPTPQMFIRKATAAIVQWWFINGYNTGDLDNSLSLGSLNINQKKDNSTFRKLVGLDALLLIQKSGLWENRVFGVDITKQLMDLGIDTNDILLTNDALQLFQQKNDYDNNFHSDIDFSNELTGLDIDRWIKIVETTNKHISFNLTGGSDLENARALIFIDKDDIDNSNAYIFSTKLITQEQKPSYYAKNENGTLSVYVKIADDMQKEKAHFLISDIYADEAGEYKLFGSQTNDTDLKELVKANVLQAADITILEAQIKIIQEEIKKIEAAEQRLENNEQQIKILSADNTTNKAEIANLKNQQIDNTNQINTNIQNIAINLSKIESVQTGVLKSDGTVEMVQSFVPIKDFDIITLKYLKETEQRIRAEFTQLTSGFYTEWEGNEAFVKVPSLEEAQIDITPLLPQVGNAFEIQNKRQLSLTLELSDREETIITRIGNDNKWDEVIVEYAGDKKKQIIQIQVSTAGIARVRAIDEDKLVIPFANITEVPSLTALWQITGNVYTSNGEKINDKTIIDLEGVIL